MEFSWIYLFTAIATFRTSSGSNCNVKSNIGRDFYIGLPRAYSDISAYQKFSVNIASKSLGGVRIEMPAIRRREHISLTDNGTQFEIPFSLQHGENDTVEDKGIHLQSDVDISVSLVMHSVGPARYYNYVADGYLALPQESLSTDYIVVIGPPVTPIYLTSIVIIATENNTEVAIKFPDINGGPFPVTDKTNIKLNRLESYMVNFTLDLTNTRIKSNKPVAVISACVAAKVPIHAALHSETIFELLPPNTFAGYNFIVPPVPYRLAHVIKIFAVEDLTFVTVVSNSSNQITTTLYKDIYKELEFKTEPVVIYANKPIMVYQYGTASRYLEYYGAFIRQVPAIENYVTEMPFLIQGLLSYLNDYVTIIIPQDDFGDVVIENFLHEKINFTGAVKLVVGKKSFSYVNLIFGATAGREKRGEYLLHSLKENVYFGALVAGYQHGLRQAYGYPLGLQTTDCRVNSLGLYTTPALSTQPPKQTLPTAHGSTETSTTLTVTTLAVSIAPPTSMTVNVPANSSLTTPYSALPNTQTTRPFYTSGPLCLSCEDLSHLFLCTTLARCAGNQVCYVERYSLESHQTRYRTGCRDKTKCSTVKRLTSYGEKRSHVFECIDCCHGDLCNNRGCGGNVLPPLTLRGPVCLDCQHVLNMDECLTLTICQKGQVCYTEVTDVAGLFKEYSLGCKTGQCIRKRRVFGRSSTNCESCCHTDFCNRECKLTPDPSIIGNRKFSNVFWNELQRQIKYRQRLLHWITKSIRLHQCISEILT